MKRRGLIKATSTVLIGLTLCSCMSLNERHVDKAYSIPETPEGFLFSGEGRVLRPALYFMQKSTGKLVAELRAITVAIDESPAKSIVKQLIVGPTDDTLEAVAPVTLSVDKVEISSDVANVYFLTPRQLSPTESFILKLSLANTLSDHFSVKYVNVFYNGLSDGFEGYPHPLQKRTTSVWTDAYDNTLGNHIAAEKDEEDEGMNIGIVLETPLYFFDASGEYLMPEVREISYMGSDELPELLAELAKGPRNNYIYRASVNKSLALSETLPRWESSEMGDALYLDFATPPDDGKGDIKTYIALVYTLTSFYPNLKTVYFSIQGEPVTWQRGEVDLSDGITRSEAFGHLAGGIDLFFQQKGDNLLVKVNRMVNEDQAWSASGRLAELINGPKKSENELATSVIPEGITSEDILSATISQSTLVVNLSQNFKDQCRGLSTDQEMILVFAMVNTLTGMKGVNSVQFLVEGKRSETLSGHLYFGDVFISNPGIVVTDY